MLAPAEAAQNSFSWEQAQRDEPDTDRGSPKDPIHRAESDGLADPGHSTPRVANLGSVEGRGNGRVEEDEGRS